MVNRGFGEAFSAGFGLAAGLTITQLIFQTVKQPRLIVKQVIICLKCSGKNPVENKFFGQCGQAFHPSTSINCPSCGTPMPSHMKFCGRCGSQLREKRVKLEKGGLEF